MTHQPSLFEKLAPTQKRSEPSISENEINALLLEANNAESENGAYYYLMQCTATHYVLRVQRWSQNTEFRRDEQVALGTLQQIRGAALALAEMEGH